MNGEETSEMVVSGALPIIKRDKAGRWLKGTKAALGIRNPERSKHVTWRHAFMRAMTVKDVLAAVEGLRKAVENGEAWAIKELLDRTLGKADQRLEITGDGGGPVETEITLRLKFADRTILENKPVPPGGLLPPAESDTPEARGWTDAERDSGNGQRRET